MVDTGDVISVDVMVMLAVMWLVVNKLILMVETLVMYSQGSKLKFIMKFSFPSEDPIFFYVQFLRACLCRVCANVLIL